MPTENHAAEDSRSRRYEYDRSRYASTRNENRSILP